MRASPRVRVGVALTNSATRGNLDAFCSALAAAGGLEVTGVGLWHYPRLLEALEVGDVDVAWLPPILAAQASQDGRAVPLALPVRNGVSSYSTALFASEGSALRRVEELSRVRAAWVDRQSVSGYLLIRASLRARGIDLDQAFGESRFFGSHEAVVQAVLEGKADVGATFVYLDAVKGTPVRSGWGAAKVRVLAHAGPIPADVIAVGARVPLKISEEMQRLLIDQRHPRLREASSALFGTNLFTAPIAAHLTALAALLPSLDEHAQPRAASWPKRPV